MLRRFFPLCVKQLLLSLTSILLLGSGISESQAAQPLHLASDPAISPDGKRLAFAWNGDLWITPAQGGRARRLTSHTAEEARPLFSPDGRRIAFVSNRSGSRQIYLMPAAGGEPTQLTFHTEGYDLLQWDPAGESLLVSSQRDHFWRHALRVFEIGLEPRTGERMLADAPLANARRSPDRKRIAFTLEGTQWWRQGYRGSQATQLWLLETADDGNVSYRNLVQEPAAAREPQWLPDGRLLYISERSGAFNVWIRDLGINADTRLTEFESGIVWEPSVAADGSFAIFRHDFDFWRLDLTQPNQAPQRLVINAAPDDLPDPIVRNLVSDASEAAFTDDALEITFIAGGDLWVMDTELREPKRITMTTEPESEPLFDAKRETIYFVSEVDGRADLWQAKRQDTNQPWWLNAQFLLERITDDSATESSLTLSPDGKTLAFVKGKGDLVLMDLATRQTRTLLQSWNAPRFSFSPDSLWITFEQADNDFNQDVFIVDVAGTMQPVNISRHPDNEGNPVWSPDGRIIAFTGRRDGDETDIHFVYVAKEFDEQTQRDRRLQQAIEKFEKERGKIGPPPAPTPAPMNPDPATPATPAGPVDPNAPPAQGTPAPANLLAPPVDPPAPGTPTPATPPATTPVPPANPEPPAAPAPPAPPGDETDITDLVAPADEPAASAAAANGANASTEPKPIRVDLDEIHLRVRTVSIPDTSEGNLFWSPDSKSLAFVARIKGQEGVYTIQPDEKLEPTLLTTTTGSSPRWLKKGNQIVWLTSGKPAALDTNSKQNKTFDFQVRHDYLRSAKFRTAFALAWRAMRDSFYDGNLNHRNWDEVRRRYEPMAESAVNEQTLQTVIHLMLGELNGSHLGFMISDRNGRSANAAPTWNETTLHLGVRFDPTHPGPGLKIRDVIFRGPADQDRSRLNPGEIIQAIDAIEVDPAMDLTKVLNGTPDIPKRLRVAGTDGTVRDVELRPITFGNARSLLYEHWTRENERKVAEWSQGRFGYLHIAGMNETSFRKFEQQLYSVGAGKEALVIDVRENGGGSTADHLLTALTQPVHAITVPRDGGPGYPHDRKIYATWNKPIIVLCNQNSFSNAEIFSHAIRNLGRGRLVGVRTAGGVISTGATSILDIGTLRMPFRGWFSIADGEDMELNGAQPHLEIWPLPGEWPAGIDRQLESAVKALEEDVTAWNARPQPTLRRASERPRE